MQVKRMVISTYQAASGAGQAAMDELELQTKEVLEGKEVTKNIFPFQVSSILMSRLLWCLEPQKMCHFYKSFGLQNCSVSSTACSD